MFGERVYKLIMIGTVLCLLALGYTAFRNKEDMIKKESDVEAKEEMVLWHYWENSTMQKELDRLVKEYNKSQGRCTVRVEYIPFVEFRRRLSLSTITSELPDIALIDNVDHRYYSSLGILKDITNEVKEMTDLKQYHDNVLKTCMFNERIYGVPFGINCLALYYNKDILEEVNVQVPASWDELREVAKKVTSEDRYGFGICTIDSEEGMYQFLPLLWSTGGTVLDINSENGLETFTLLDDLIKDGSMSRSAINLTQGDLMEQFIAGDIAMMINTPTKAPELLQRGKHINWDVTYIPYKNEKVSILGGENLVIINKEDTENALDFLEYIIDENKILSYISRLGFIAPRKDIMEKQYINDINMRKFISMLDVAKERDYDNWAYISKAITDAINKCVIGDATPVEAVEMVQVIIDSIGN